MKNVAIFKEWKIVINKDDSVSVFKNGELCSNSKEALREISEQKGFKYDENWNTRQFGKNLSKDISKKKGGCLKRMFKFFIIFFLILFVLTMVMIFTQK